MSDTTPPHLIKGQIRLLEDLEDMVLKIIDNTKQKLELNKHQKFYQTRTLGDYTDLALERRVMLIILKEWEEELEEIRTELRLKIHLDLIN